MTDDDEAAFFQYLNITSVDQISNHVNSMVDQASLVTGRSMRVDNLEVTANVSTKGLSEEGIVQYQFDWIGFAARIDPDKIKIGDAFSGELDLSRDDELEIKFPGDYVVVSVYPSPDNTQAFERSLAWFGPRNFGAGEPHALFDKKNFSWTDAVIGNLPLLAVAVAAISTGTLGYFLGQKRARSSGVSKPSDSQGLSLPSALIVEGDEEKVVRLLDAAGGRMYQSTIAEQCGFSKSKASELMSAMETKGVVSRKKIGRGKIVTLVKKKETEKGS